MVSRRSFVQQSLTALVGSSAVLGFACTPKGKADTAADTSAGSNNRLSAIGLQLYTVRTEMEKSLERTLERVAQIGYKEVEFAGYFGKTPRQIADVLKNNGLTAPSAHVDLRQPWDKTLADAKTIGHEYVVVPWIDEANRTPEAMRKLAADFNTRADAAKKVEIQFAYHNHDFEFKPVDSGKLLYDLLLENTDPSLVKMEMDLYWITFAGQDPLAYWRKYPGRFPMVHVKDMTADRTMTSVGLGKIPFAQYFAQRELAGVKHYFVEHDQPADPFASITSSYQHLAQLKF